MVFTNLLLGDKYVGQYGLDKEFSERYYKENFDEEESKKLLRFMWSVDSLCEKFGHQLIQFDTFGKGRF